MRFKKMTYGCENVREKNGVSIHDGSATQYGGPHKVLSETSFGCSKSQTHRLIHTKIEVFAWFQKRHVYAKMGEENGVNIYMWWFPTPYGDPYKVFWENNFWCSGYIVCMVATEHLICIDRHIVCIKAQWFYMYID